MQNLRAVHQPGYRARVHHRWRCVPVEFLALRSATGRLFIISPITFEARGQRGFDQYRGREPSSDEVIEFRRHMKERLHGLATAISSNQATTRRQVPQHAKILDRVRAWLAENREWPIAGSPNAR